MVAYAEHLDTSSPTVTHSATTSGFVRIVYSANDTTTATSDPWQATPTAYSTITYTLPPPEPDWAEVARAERRAASMVPPPRENRAKERRLLKERRGFQQMCRLPCYRGTRTR